MEFRSSNEAVAGKDALRQKVIAQLSTAITQGIQAWEADSAVTGPVKIPLDGGLDQVYRSHQEEFDGSLADSGWKVRYNAADFGHDVQPGDPFEPPTLYLHSGQ